MAENPFRALGSSQRRVVQSDYRVDDLERRVEFLEQTVEMLLTNLAKTNNAVSKLGRGN